jgi:hypothetical protein
MLLMACERAKTRIRGMTCRSCGVDDALRFGTQCESQADRYAKAGLVDCKSHFIATARVVVVVDAIIPINVVGDVSPIFCKAPIL